MIRANLFVHFIGAVLFAALCSCSTLNIPELDSSINYQRDLKFKIQIWDGENWSEKKTYIGIAVVPKADKYKIKIYAVGKADMITLSSCHRETKKANPESSWYSSGVEFEFIPIHQHESERACGIEAGIYEKKKGRHGWASIVIDSDRENMSAKLKCNGEIIEVESGTSFCQAKKGLIQSIHFDRDVEIVNYVGCVLKTPEKGYGKDWVYLMPPGKCVFFFIDRNNSNNIHKSVHFGYDTIPIRGVN